MKEISRNVLLVNIFYGKMSYQKLEEQFAYDVHDMIGEKSYKTTVSLVPKQE